MKFSIITAFDKNRGIGKSNQLPWYLPEDLKHFAKITKGEDINKINAVIMGRKTWESIPEKFRPLPGRLNIVLTRQSGYNLPESVKQAANLDEALNLLDQDKNIGQAFVIGGASVYEQAIMHPGCEKIYVTEVNAEMDCDTFFPEITKEFSLSEQTEEQTSEKLIKYRFCEYQRNS